ncbi:hypothetical protein TL16_g04059 [Triparma laevis f. inornata]|uniref:Uncharacterized protein n=1 Tax=Triparma laevis f. inornata TaxID=1714386 RepID=A0A9W7E3X8_9STRA|nr:hypothetical protein TL16_g04059 [Triparma laevis f. inornata]
MHSSSHTYNTFTPPPHLPTGLKGLAIGQVVNTTVPGGHMAKILSFIGNSQALVKWTVRGDTSTLKLTQLEAIAKGRPTRVPSPPSPLSALVSPQPTVKVKKEKAERRAASPKPQPKKKARKSAPDKTPSKLKPKPKAKVTPTPSKAKQTTNGKKTPSKRSTSKDSTTQSKSSSSNSTPPEKKARVQPRAQSPKPSASSASTPSFRRPPPTVSSTSGMRQEVKMSKIRTAMYNQKAAANHAANHMWPWDNQRHLGSIVLSLETVTYTVELEDGTKETTTTPPDKVASLLEVVHNPATNPLRSREAQSCYKSLPVMPTKSELKLTAKQSEKFSEQKLNQEWEEVRSINKSKAYADAFNSATGQFTDKTTVSLLHLYDLFAERDSESVESNPPLIDLNEFHSSFDGRTVIDLSAGSIIESLLDLATCTSSGWHTPCMTTRSHLENVKAKGKDAASFNVIIDVYASRLIFESLLSKNCVTVFKAFHPSSVNITRPLLTITEPAVPSFEADPNSKLIHPENPSYFNNEGHKSAEEISCFSVKGVMKMFDTFGCDMGMYEGYKRVIEPSLKLNLMRHQKEGISWMLEQESLGGYGINSLFWEEREWADGGKFYFSPHLGQLRLTLPDEMRGGILADEMGLGKTVMTVGLIAATLNDMKKNKPKGASHATLIIVPPSLAKQWMTEIAKSAKNLSTYLIDPKQIRTQMIQTWGASGKEAILKDIRNACYSHDIVVTTYQAVSDSNIGKLLGEEVEFGRVCLDEMQEIRSSSSNIAKSCESINAGRRWMISGTPLFDGLNDLKAELNFLRVSPFSAKSEDGFWNFLIGNHFQNNSETGVETVRQLSRVILRRSKDMTFLKGGDPIMGLPPKTVNYIAVKQTHSERTFYSFLEWIVYESLKDKVDAVSGETRDGIEPRNRAGQQQSALSIVRLLRDMCISPVLISGGHGIKTNAMALLQKICTEFNMSNFASRSSQARNIRSSGGERDGGRKIMNPEEALNYLSHMVHDKDRGGNRDAGRSGAGERQVAVDDVHVQLRKATFDSMDAEGATNAASRSRAQLNWWLALDLITTGDHRSLEIPARVDKEILSLWLTRREVKTSWSKNNEAELARSDTVFKTVAGTKHYLKHRGLDEAEEIDEDELTSDRLSRLEVELVNIKSSLADEHKELKSEFPDVHEFFDEKHEEKISSINGTGNKLKAEDKKKPFWHNTEISKELKKVIKAEIDFDSKEGREEYSKWLVKVHAELMAQKIIIYARNRLKKEKLILRIEKSSLKKRSGERRTVREDLREGEDETMKRIAYLTSFLSSGWRTDRFLIRMMLVAHPGWHWLRSDTLELMRLPKSIKAKEIADALFESAQKVPAAEENLAKSKELAAEAETKFRTMTEALMVLLGQMKEHYQDYVDPALGPWDSTNNVKRWNKKDKAGKKEHEKKQLSATKDRDKAFTVVGNREKELVAAKKWDRLIAVKPKVVLIELSATENRGYAVFDHGEGDEFEKEMYKRGDAQLFQYICRSQLISKKKISSSSEDSREVNFGVKVVSANPPEVIAEKLAEANAEVEKLTTLVNSQMAEESRLNLAKSLRDVAEGGLRLKLSSDGVKNFPMPCPDDRGNIWVVKSCSAQLQKNGKDNKGVSNRLHAKLGSRMGLRKDDEDVRYYGGYVVKVYHSESATKKDKKDVNSWKTVEAVDLELFDGSLVSEVLVHDLVDMDSQLMIRSSSRSLDYVDSLTQTLATTNDKMLRSKTLAGNHLKRIEVLKKAVGNSSDGRLAERSSVQSVLAIKNGTGMPSCPICLSDVGTGKSDEANILEGTEDEQPNIAMIACGHIICRSCLDNFVETSKAAKPNQKPSCAECRKPFDMIKDVVLIEKNSDDEKEKRKAERKAEIIKLKEGLKSIEELFDGSGEGRFQWQPSASRALFIAQDGPEGSRADDERCVKYPSIEGSAIRFLRAAVGLPFPVAKKDERPVLSLLESEAKVVGGAVVVGSKVRQLLKDLKVGEHSVIFTQSKDFIFHLVEVFGERGIGFKALYLGQDTSESQESIAEWKSVGVGGRPFLRFCWCRRGRQRAG